MAHRAILLWLAVAVPHSSSGEVVHSSTRWHKQPANLHEIQTVLEGVTKDARLTSAQRGSAMTVANGVRDDIATVVFGKRGVRRRKLTAAMKEFEVLERRIKQGKLSPYYDDAAEDAAGDTEPADSASAGAKGGQDKVANSTPMPRALDAIDSNLQTRAKSLKAYLVELDTEEKESEAKLDASEKQSEAIAKKHINSDSVDEYLFRGRTMFKKLKKEDHRRYEETRRKKKAELNEIAAAIESLKTGNVKALQAAHEEMAKDSKSLKVLSAKSGKFLY